MAVWTLSVSFCFVAVFALILLRRNQDVDISLSPMGLAQSIDLLAVDARQLQRQLSEGRLTSRRLVELYLEQIAKHDDYLHAMISVMPRSRLEQRADTLDAERRAGKLRGPLHGIPIIVKDNIATHPDLELGTTAGSLALQGSRPGKNARLVDKLINSGAIILGKSNLSFSNYRGDFLPSGWSAMGGQCQSAYVRGGLDPTDTKDGHSSPSGSSSGSAVGVSAGYAPLAIGTETDGSLICPAGRAALYTIKPTIGLVPQEGIVPVSANFDSAGPLTKTVFDLAMLLDVIADRDDSTTFTSNLTSSWADISVATLDPDLWKFPDTFIRPDPRASEQIMHDINDAYNTIRSKAKKYVENVPLPTIDAFKVDGENTEMTITRADMKKELNAYLESLETSKVRSLEDVIEFNKNHQEQELPPSHSNQDFFIRTEAQNMSASEYDRHLRHLRQVAGPDGIDKILQEYKVDVIIGPADSFITSIATGSGYPVAGMPLSYLKFNGRPLGLAALAGKNQEAVLINVLSAWESTFPPREPPPMLLGQRVGGLVNL